MSKNGYITLAIIMCIFLVCVLAAITQAVQTRQVARMESPESCGGCHSIGDSYESWKNSSHKNVVCNQCHLPHDVTFLTRSYDSNITVSEKGKEHMQQSCVRCHEPMFNEKGRDYKKHSEGRNCTSCHKSMAHPTEPDNSQ
jgi:cytochrome c nitrite reductase small subunit